MLTKYIKTGNGITVNNRLTGDVGHFIYLSHTATANYKINGRRRSLKPFQSFYLDSEHEVMVIIKSHDRGLRVVIDAPRNWVIEELNDA